MEYTYRALESYAGDQHVRNPFRKFRWPSSSSSPSKPRRVGTLFLRFVAAAIFFTFIVVISFFGDLRSSFYSLGGRPIWSGSIIDSKKVEPLFTPGPTKPYDPSVNPLIENAELVHGPWRAVIPETVFVGEAFIMTIECFHEEPTFCPPSYYIQFYGPVAAPVPITSFNQTSERTVEAFMTLHEPGDYQVYAWPNDPQCERWQMQENIVVPVYKRAVEGSPFDLRVSAISSYSPQGRKTNGASRTDTHKQCTSYEEIIDGRWINHKNIVPSISAQYGLGLYHPTRAIQESYGLGNYPQSRYTYSPYDCKIPHRNIIDVIDALPEAKHFLFVGDSVARGYVCTRVFVDLFGPDNLGVCEFHPESKVWEHGNKQAEWTHPDPTKNRKVNITLAFTHAEINDIWPFLDTLVPKPDYIVFNMGYWIDFMEDDAFKKQYTDFFNYVDANWAGTHVIVRSTTSVIQPINCFQAGHHSRQNSFRERRIALEATNEWAQRINSTTTATTPAADGTNATDVVLPVRQTKVSFVDAYTITDRRPECTVDGYHWAYHAPQLDKLWYSWNITVRPAVGEAEDMLQDWMWDEFVTGRAINQLD